MASTTGFAVTFLNTNFKPGGMSNVGQREDRNAVHPSSIGQFIRCGLQVGKNPQTKDRELEPHRCSNKPLF